MKYNELVVSKEKCESAAIIFERKFDGVFEVVKDRYGKHSDVIYVGIDEVLDALNTKINVIVVDQNGMQLI